MSSIFEKLFGGGQKQETRKLPTVEEAIAAWESDGKKNPGHLKIVRGVDGKPVEIVFEGRNSTVIVNSEEISYNGTEKGLSQILGDLEFKNFLTQDIYDGWYEIRSNVHVITSDAQGFHKFVAGQKGEYPENYPVNFRVQ